MAENEVVNYLLKHVVLSDELIQIIRESSIIKAYKKGTILLKEGDYVNESYLVFKGCIRCYVIKDGEEKTIEFYTEEQPVSPIGYGQNIASEYYLECIEDTVASIGSPAHEQAMFKKYPQFESICRIMSDVIMANFQASFTGYKLANAEERYLNLLKTRPDLVQRVPQYQLASYLGIKPESLSRIRKRLGKK